MISRFFFILLILCIILATGRAQNTLQFPVDDINTLIRNGTVQVSHDVFDIGSISDVFDHNDQSLARSAAINPLTITLTFPFPVTFGGSSILQTYGNGWWTLEAADTPYDLAYQTGSYVNLLQESSLLDGLADEVTFTPETKRIVKLTVKRTTGDDYVHLNEWQLIDAYASVEMMSVCTRPSSLWLLPGKSFTIELYGYDHNGDAYVIHQDIHWELANNDHVTLEELDNGTAVITASQAPGEVMVQAQWQDLSFAAPVHVVNDFSPVPSNTRIVKVALVLIDPPIAAEGGLRFHERFGWDDPVYLAETLADSLDAAGGGAVDYQIISTYDEDILYAALEGTFISVDSMYRLFLEPGWTTFHQLEQTGGFAFDYNGLLAAHNFCAMSNEAAIDEVWVYSMPFTGMYESRLTGEGAFWYNSPPLDGNDCVDQLPVMGFNYERGVAEAMHSFGHRVESAMAHTYGRWDYNAIEKNDWEKFTSYDKANPSEGHVGNIHYPVNGISDYDYENHSIVASQSGNWKFYPFLFSDKRSFSCEEWGCSHLGYMSWWFHHLPHVSCRNRDGILNNWWAYIVDYNEGRSQELFVPDCDCMYVNNTTSTQQLSPDLFFTISPNPAKEIIRLHFQNDVHEGNISIYDERGILVKQRVIGNSSKDLTINIAHLLPGIYNVIFQHATGRYAQSFVVK